jgi:hypothetical protein
METTRATLIIGGMIARNVETIFLPKSPHDSLGPPGKLFVPVYLKAIFGRGLVATLEADGVGSFEVRIGNRGGRDGGQDEQPSVQAHQIADQSGLADQK